MTTTRESSREEAQQGGSLTSGERVLRIQTISAKLAELTVLNTPTSRARCIALADELVTLLMNEDEYRRPLPGEQLDTHEAAKERLAEALRGCREAHEQCELTRLYIMSERLERKA